MRSQICAFLGFRIEDNVEGVRANSVVRSSFGLGKCYKKVLLTFQHNRFVKAQEIVLGHLDVQNEMDEVKDLDFNDSADRAKLSQTVAKIDKEVTHIIFTIINLEKRNHHLRRTQ